MNCTRRHSITRLNIVNLKPGIHVTTRRLVGDNLSQTRRRQIVGVKMRRRHLCSGGGSYTTRLASATGRNFKMRRRHLCSGGVSYTTRLASATGRNFKMRRRHLCSGGGSYTTRLASVTGRNFKMRRRHLSSGGGSYTTRLASVTGRNFCHCPPESCVTTRNGGTVNKQQFATLSGSAKKLRKSKCVTRTYPDVTRTYPDVTRTYPGAVRPQISRFIY